MLVSRNRGFQGTFASTVAGLLTAVMVGELSAQTLVPNPYTTINTGWVDAFPPPTRAGNWRYSLHNPTLMDTNNANPPSTGATPNDGTYQPDVLIQNNFLAPANYELNVTARSNDDDLIGVVWNYQDPNNYFRVGIRQQLGAGGIPNGNFGGTDGLAVQKIVGGVVTQIVPNGIGQGVPSPITQAMIDNRTPFDLKVAVTGTNYEVFFNGVSITSGTDAALVSGRKVGLQSWAQQADAAAVTPFWGSEFETVSVNQGATNLFTETFNTPKPVKFRQVNMANQAGATGLTGTNSREILGNFGHTVNRPWIHQDSNGFLNATVSNTDFIGPTIVVDEPGSAAFTNYEMRTRIGAGDNDGMGVLVRVQNDNTFYRVTFASEATGATINRAPQGMSVQKSLNGVWTELYRETTPLFVFPFAAVNTNPDAANFPWFDLKVGVVGDTIKVQVRDAANNVYNYPLIQDTSSPILSGSVGLTTWGTEDVFYTGYGGLDTPLVRTLTSLKDVDLVIDRGTGNVSLLNNDPTPVNIKGVSLISTGGALKPGSWTSIADAYDEAPGNGSVDPDDPWTETSATVFNLSEAEQSGGNGGTIAAGGSVNLGSAWTKSRIEDLIADLTLTDNSAVSLDIIYNGAPVSRSDLNGDNAVNASDWPLFYPNMLANLSSLTAVGKALAGDLDGDGDNDVNDFSLFKTDYDVANGAGAFNAMLAGVPEPGTLLLFGLGCVMLAGRRFRRVRPVVAAIMCSIAITTSAERASAVAVDFTTYTVENFPVSSGFGVPAWVITPTSATHQSNADASVVYAPDSALNKRYVGLLRPGTDDDVVGFVIGFEPGDAQIGSVGADYLLIDWKGATQTFDFIDVVGGGAFFQDQTPSGVMPIGLALSRVTGTDPPTADELWQHIDYVENPNGHITELARGATLGSSAYNQANGTHVVDIRYTATNVTVLVNGVEQFNQNGSFPDGRFGLYSAFQGPPPTFSNFEVVPATGFSGLSAEVDRSNGNITLKNTGTAPLNFNFYQFSSAAGSLNEAGWNSLSEQNIQIVSGGNDPGESWDEAGGSSNAALAEVFLLDHPDMAGGTSIPIGNAYNHTMNAEDLVLTYRLASGLIVPAPVTYIGVAAGVPGDYNGNGVVDAADYVLWRNGGPLQNEVDNPGTVNAADYTAWRARFGNTSGSGSGLGGAAGVPEPATLGLGLCVGMMLLARRFRTE